MRQFAEHADWVGGMLLPGGKHFPRPASLPKGFSTGFTLGEMITKDSQKSRKRGALSSPPPPPTPAAARPKADREKAAVPFANFQFDIDSKLRDQKTDEFRLELRKLDKGKPVEAAPAKLPDTNEQPIPKGMTLKDTVLCAAATLPSPFTVKMVVRALVKAGFPDMEKRHGSVNMVLHTAFVKGEATKEGRGLYVLNVGARPTTAAPEPLAEIPQPQTMTAPAPTAVPESEKTSPERPKKAANVMERLATVVASGLMMNPDDETILEQTLEMLFKAQEIVRRTIQAHAMRAALVDAVRANGNEQ